MKHLIPQCILILILGCTPKSEDTQIETIAETNSSKALMAVFAHPDDESTVAPILSRYVKEGIKVHLIIATDGRLGVNDHTDHEAGDGLAAMRREEMKCAADILGVELIHLTYHDQLKAEEGYDGHMPHARSLIKELHRIITDIKPNVLITFGPDGGSNHMDHRLIGATTTAVFLSEDWSHDMSLYYCGQPSHLITDKESKILRGVHPKHMTTKISFTAEDLERSIESITCHKSQFQMDGIGDRFSQRYEQGNYIYLRKFVGPTEHTDNVF